MFYCRVNELHELRLLKISDDEELFALTNANRDYLRQWLPWLDSIHQINDTRSFIRSTIWQVDDNRGFVAAICYEGNIVGTIGFNWIDWQNRIGYIGYWLASSHQGKGMMTRSCQSLIDYGFDTFKLNRLVIACATENRRSRGIPERLGFTHEGRARAAEWLYDRFVDHEIYALLNHEPRYKSFDGG
jgi:ribosomal-protein-serine acetyltransferase